MRKKPLELDQYLLLLFLHFVPSTLVTNLMPLAFLFSHLVFFAVGLWTLHDQKNILPVIVVSVHSQMGDGESWVAPPFLKSLKMLCR